MNKNSLKTASTIAALCVACSAVSPASASVLQGMFDDIYESNVYTIGSGATTLSFEWSTDSPNSSGFFYTGGVDGVAVYVAQGLADPTTITNAASFVYQASGAPKAQEGDTVFLRSVAGVYAAIALKDFVRLDPPVLAPGGGFSYRSTLDANWYVDTSGTGNFTTPVPEPSAYGLMVAGLALLAYRRRSRRSAV